MSPEQFSANIEKLRQSLATELPQINEKAALNITSLVKNRVINTGVNGDDKYLGEYEDTPYKKKREKAGHQTDYVDLNYTGQTFRDIGVKSTIVDGQKTTTSIGPKDTKNRKGGVKTSEIAEGNAKRYGNFLKPNKEEIELASNQFAKEITKIVKNTFE